MNCWYFTTPKSYAIIRDILHTSQILFVLFENTKSLFPSFQTTFRLIAACDSFLNNLQTYTKGGPSPAIHHTRSFAPLNIHFPHRPGPQTFHVPITYQFFKRYENLCQVTSALIFHKPSIFKALRGYDKIWKHTGNRRSATIPNFMPNISSCVSKSLCPHYIKSARTTVSIYHVRDKM